MVAVPGLLVGGMQRWSFSRLIDFGAGFDLDFGFDGANINDCAGRYYD